MSGIIDASLAANVHAMFFLGMQKHSAQADNQPTDDTALSHNSVYDYAMLSGADSYIIACGSLTGYSGVGAYQQFMERFDNVPNVVLQERIATTSPKQTYIIVDNYNSYTQCIEHLITVHGYRRIAFVSGPEGHADARERQRAYLDCMARHGLPVDDGMIVHGSFYEYIDQPVSDLMDRYPDLQAIAFANDEMAKAGYRECRRRGLVVGRDIAITGFDNFSFCHSMEPPLTTISQNTYRMGYLAVEKAIDLIHGKLAPPTHMQTEFIQRQSCGCVRDTFCFTPQASVEEGEAFIDYAIATIAANYSNQFSSDERARYQSAFHDCLAVVRALVLNRPDEPLDMEQLTSCLNAFLNRSPQPVSSLASSLDDVLTRLLCACSVSPAVRKFATAVSGMRQYFAAREVRNLEARCESMQQQSWIAPELTRGLYGQNNDAETFRRVADRLKAAGLRHVHICLLENPQRYVSGGLETIPQKLLLAAAANGGETVAYPRESMPVIDAQHPFGSLPGFQDANSLMSFSFFSGENQYGILLCEADVTKSTLLHVIGLQLGMLIDFMELRRREEAIAVELEAIREKNEILNFLSEYDLMCGLLNRRGFIERAIRLNRDNIGKTAYCAFVDLDYLKQINDTFGHPEGDIALTATSRILQRCVSEYDLLGRIGGDEFVGLFITDAEDFEERFLQKLRQECDAYNEASEKPYILDVSAGVAKFLCQQGLEVSSIIAEADRYLYAAKRSRSFHSLRYRISPDLA